MKKTITNDEILDAVYDIADARGIRIDEFIAQLQEDYADAELPEKYADGGLPEEVLAELENAKALRKEMRDSKRKSDEETRLREDIASFRELFPEVKAEEIPEEVWAEVASCRGMDLKHAYALYVLTGKQSGGHAEEVNRETAARSAAAASDGSTEPSFTPEQVEKMTPKDVAKNYKSILQSFKNWR